MLKLYWHQGIIGLWIRFCNDIHSCITPRSSSFWFHWVSFPSVSCLTWSLWILPSNPLCVACYVWLRMSSFCLCLVSMSLSLFPCHSLSCSLSVFTFFVFVFLVLSLCRLPAFPLFSQSCLCLFLLSSCVWPLSVCSFILIVSSVMCIMFSVAFLVSTAKNITNKYWL